MSNVENVQPALLNAFLLTTKDALMVLEAANRGICPVVSRRLHDSEKASMVKSGSVFAFDEQTTGIKRWTDGTLWSPSRIIGNYLVYRELESKGDKGAAAVQLQVEDSNADSSSSSNLPSPSQTIADPFAQTSQLPLDAANKKPIPPAGSRTAGSTGLQRDVERALIGSLTSSYRFKPNGLVKKTYSNGSLHLICYYTIEDVVAGRLRSPSSLMELSSLEISPALLQIKNFRLPPLMEIDPDGISHYAGEETDPSSTPASLEPMVSPTAVHRQLPEPLNIYQSSHAVPSGLPTAEYEAHYADHGYEAMHEAAYPSPHSASQYHYPAAPAASYEGYYPQATAIHPPAQSHPYGSIAHPIPPYYHPPESGGSQRPSSPQSAMQPLPARPYTARAAPVARTIYRPNPYGRRASDAAPVSAPPQSHFEVQRRQAGPTYQGTQLARRPPDVYPQPPQYHAHPPPQ